MRIMFTLDHTSKKLALLAGKFRRKFKFSAERLCQNAKNTNSAMCKKRSTGIFKDQSELKSLAEQVIGFRSYIPLEKTQ